MNKFEITPDNLIHYTTTKKCLKIFSNFLTQHREKKVFFKKKKKMERIEAN